mgnify:CR=1 FL=1
MAEYIIKSRAVFDGRADSCKPLAVWIKDDRIKKLLPYDETNAVPADVPIYDMGDKLVMPSFIDAQVNMYATRWMPAIRNRNVWSRWQHM